MVIKCQKCGIIQATERRTTMTQYVMKCKGCNKSTKLHDSKNGFLRSWVLASTKNPREAAHIVQGFKRKEYERKTKANTSTQS